MKSTVLNKIQQSITIIHILLLSAIESAAAAGITFLIAADPQNAFFLGRSLSRWVLIITLFSAALLAAALGMALRNRPARRKQLDGMFSSRTFSLIVCGFFALLFAAFVALKINPAVLQRLAPALVWFWLTGLQCIFFGLLKNPPIARVEPASGKPWLAIVSVLALVLAAALPLPPLAQSDGIPWNTPLEFIGMALLLPAALIINWRALAKPAFMAVSLIFLAARIILAFLLPQAGLDVRVYASPADWQADKMIRSYESIIHPEITSVMTRSYTVTREFPIEFINKDRFNVRDFWLGMDLSGYLTIKDNEKVVFLVLGSQQADITLTDLSSNATISGTVLHSLSEITPGLYQNLPPLQTARLSARFVFTGDQHFQIIPLLIEADGGHRPLIESGRAWRTSPAAQSSLALQSSMPLVLQLHDIFFLLIFLATLGLALWERYQASQLDSLDLYLAAASILAFWAVQALTRSQIVSIFQPALIAILAIRILGLWVAPSSDTAKKIWGSTGLLALVLFMGIYFPYLREIEVFPQGEDNFRYQVISRYIYLSGDFFQLRQPPLVYKFLYPYLVGFLHLFFGQSPAAQHMLNAFCSLLTAAWISALLTKRQVHSAFSMTAAALWMLIVTGHSFYTFYFRFGLIEPLAVALRTLLILCAANHNRTGYFVTGILLTLLRLDYAILAFSTCWFFMPTITGGVKQVWKNIISWTLNHWRRLVAFGAAIAALPVSLIAFYRIEKHSLLLRADDTRQSSFSSILDGWFRIISGGNIPEIQARFSQNPIDMGLIILVLYCGVLIALLPLFLRQSAFSRFDPRWGIVTAALFFTFLLVKPTGYSPRFSTSLLPLAILAIFDSLSKWKTQQTSQRTIN